jgi:cation diffusion facilitator CzcD-associated flavoprotein CzcO
VVVGSGATAVTIVPAMAEAAEHVTMLQRSPTYVVPLPSGDKVADWLRRRLGAELAHGIIRWKNVALGAFLYRLARRRPEQTKRRIVAMAQRALGPGCDAATHFAPRYKPWDQRLCVAPDADLFEAIRSGRASVATDHVEAFTEAGIRLRSGEELRADIVVTATGLKLSLLGGVELDVDGRRVALSETMAYKGTMLSGVPNLAAVFGYTNASWTLKADLTCEYVCRLLNRMRRRGYTAATAAPRPRGRGGAPPRLLLGLRPARAAHAPQAGGEEALEAPAELRPGPAGAPVRRRRRRRPRVHPALPPPLNLQQPSIPERSVGPRGGLRPRLTRIRTSRIRHRAFRPAHP